MIELSGLPGASHSEFADRISSSDFIRTHGDPHSEGLSPNARTSTSGEFVRQMIDARIARRRFFETDLFADPAWDILLELYALRSEQRRTSVSKLCIAAAVPATTALRWIDKLHHDDLVVRTADPFDARRIWVNLSDKGYCAMRSYLAQIPIGCVAA